MLLIADAPSDWPDSIWDPIRSVTRLTVIPEGRVADAVARLGETDVLAVFRLRIPNEILDLAPRIRRIVVLGMEVGVVSPDAVRLYRLPVDHLPPGDFPGPAEQVQALRALLDGEARG